MREIKFRAWDTSAKHMLEVRELILRSDGMVKHVFDYVGEHNNEEDEVILMQFTGLKDKNDKEIYEGDIVELFNIREGGTEEGEVIWQEEYAGFIIKGKQNRLWSIEMASGYDTVTGQVIGNVYENPELLT